MARQVEDDADVPAIAERAGSREGTRGRLFETDAQSEHQRARTVVDGDSVVRVGQVLTENDLRKVVTARGELIEHLALGQEPGFLDVIERARSVQKICDPSPVRLPAGAGRSAGVGQGQDRCSHRGAPWDDTAQPMRHPAQ